MIQASQEVNARRAWRYNPQSHDADTTVTGAQLVALMAARNAGLAIPQKAIDGGIAFLMSCASPNGGFGYTSPQDSSVPRAAIGALLLTLADRQDTVQYKAAMRYLRATRYANDQSYPYYSLYYSAQAFFHCNAEDWNSWNAHNSKVLRQTQQPDGSWIGPQGPTFSTSAALLSLALNYRFLPIYER
jgi:hypothetical protein